MGDPAHISQDRVLDDVSVQIFQHVGPHNLQRMHGIQLAVAQIFLFMIDKKNLMYVFMYVWYMYIQYMLCMVCIYCMCMYNSIHVWYVLYVCMH